MLLSLIDYPGKLALVEGLAQPVLVMLLVGCRRDSADLARCRPVEILLLKVLGVDEALDVTLFLHQEGITVALQDVADVDLID